MPNKLLPLDNRVLNAANHICKWWNQSNEKGGHWDNSGYKQGLRDALVILQRHKVIKDYSMTNGITLNEFDIRK
jgi:hypothetical protein